MGRNKSKERGVDHFGRQLIIGIEGKTLTRKLSEFLKDILPSGIVLFPRNIGSPNQLKRLIADITDLFSGDVFFAIDHEGGRVHRFGGWSSITHFPGNDALGKAGQMDEAHEQGRVMAQELEALGFQVNLAPVLDVLTRRHNPAITTRSFGRDPDLVSRLGCAMIQGIQEEGMAATAKHFPGLGAATKDPHHDLPVIRASRKIMEQIHFKPFQAAIRSGVSFMMSTHVVYPHLDRSGPATLSKAIVKTLLREKLGFPGVILSDDLDMDAIWRKFDFEEAVVRTVEAGHDFVLVCHRPELVRRACEALRMAYQSGRLKESSLQESLFRLQSVFEKLKKNRN